MVHVHCHQLWAWHAAVLQAVGDGAGIEARQEPTGLPLATLQWVGITGCVCSEYRQFDMHRPAEGTLRIGRSIPS